MNTITITGRLTREPELRTAGTSTVCDLRVAVDSPDDHPTFVTVAVWGAEADNITRYLTKGRLVGITGRLSHDEWATDSGERRSRLYVTAVKVDFLDSPHTSEVAETH